MNLTKRVTMSSIAAPSCPFATLGPPDRLHDGVPPSTKLDEQCGLTAA